MNYNKMPVIRDTTLKDFAERLNKGAYEVAHQKLERKKINPRDFTGVYSKESLDDDAEYVARRKKQFEQDATMKSLDGVQNEKIRRATEVAEYVFTEGVERGWFPNCKVIKTADFDDIKNGVDCIIERQSEQGASSHLGIAIDITCAREMDDKFSKIKKILDEDSLPEIKYFKSGNFTGRLSNLPKVVAAMSPTAVERITKEINAENDIKNHTIRLILLLQFDMQLSRMHKYVAQNKPHLAQSFKVAHQTVGAIIEELSPEFKKHASDLAGSEILLSMEQKLSEYFPLSSSRPKSSGRVHQG